MCYWILPQSGIPIARTTVQNITMEELATNEVKEQLQKFDNEIHLRIGDTAEVDLLGPLPLMIHQTMQ